MQIISSAFTESEMILGELKFTLYHKLNPLVCMDLHPPHHIHTYMHIQYFKSTFQKMDMVLLEVIWRWR